MPRGTAVTVAIIELLLILLGAVLLWRTMFSPRARAFRPTPALPAWEAPISEFFLFLLAIICGAFGFAAVASIAAKHLELRGDAVTVFNGAAAQLGLLAGLAAYRLSAPRAPINTPARKSNAFLAGGLTFLIALPLLVATAKVWEAFLEVCGLPPQRQDLIEMFARTDSPWVLGTMVVLAVVIAPVTEELVFRAGLFRYFRTRMPRWVALVVPALFFASLHVNWNTFEGIASFAPLTILAVMFSLAYERTGRIGTSIVAHALFNLNTVVLILSGVSELA